MAKGKPLPQPSTHSKPSSCAGKASCPITKTAELLSDTWTMLIMRALTEGPKRFVELERWLDGISTRTLTLKLQKLSEEGMLVKSKDGLYTATEKGKGIRIIEAAMIRYSEKFLSSHKA